MGKSVVPRGYNPLGSKLCFMWTAGEALFTEVLIPSLNVADRASDNLPPDNFAASGRSAPVQAIGELLGAAPRQGICQNNYTDCRRARKAFDDWLRGKQWARLPTRSENAYHSASIREASEESLAKGSSLQGWAVWLGAGRLSLSLGAAELHHGHDQGQR